MEEGFERLADYLAMLDHGKGWLVSFCDLKESPRGISRMLDLFDREDFCVIFDYICDIEVHFNDAIEFYQIKTHKIQAPFKFADLKRIEGTQSIIAKLFLLADAATPELPIKCALVSNAFFQIGNKLKTDVESFCFDDLDEDSKEKIRKALHEELHRNTIDLRSLHYIYTSMNLLDPQNDLKGKIIGSFEKIKGCEPVRPNALYRLIVEIVEERACYELSLHNYDEIIRRKGITKTELNKIFDRHIEKSNDSVCKVIKIIEQQDIPAREKKKRMSAVSTIVELERQLPELQQKGKEIVTYIEEAVTDESVGQVVDLLITKFNDAFSIKLSPQEKYVFLLLLAKRWEDGQYI